MSILAAEHKMRVGRILRDARLDARNRMLGVWNYLIEAELAAGTQFVVALPGKQLYVVLGRTNEVIQLPAIGRGGIQWFSYMNQMYGLVESEVTARFVYNTLRSYVARHGIQAEMRRFAAFDRSTRSVYLSAYNGQMYRLDGQNVETVTIGEDGVFFADDDGGVHCAPDVGRHGQLLDRLTDVNFAPAGLSGITPEQQKRAMIVWIFALAFPDLMPTKPLLILEGVKGSGKTSAVTLLQLLLMGRKKPIVLRKNKEDDFGVILLRSPIALLDNVDSYIDWIPDAVGAYTTGAGWHSRKLYTDDEHLEIKPHAFIAVSTRNPASFRRDDVADRCLILRLDRRKSFVSTSALEEMVLENRAQLLGEYFWYVNAIVRELRAQGQIFDAQSDRMADFAALARVVGRVLEWPADAVDELMEAMQGERDAFINEDDATVELLTRWIAYRPAKGPSNIGRAISAIDLHRELETLAAAMSLEWHDSPRTLAQKLRLPNIERLFRVEVRIVGQQKQFQIWRHTDARLELVASEDQMLEVPE